MKIKFTLLKNEIEATIAKLLTPAVYYVIIGIMAFSIVITLILLSGYFLNLWLQSDYLGYVVLLGFFLVMMSLSVLYQRKFRKMIRQMLMPKEIG